VLIAPGEEIITGDGRKLRVLELVPVDDEGAQIQGMLTVEPACGRYRRGRG
jgi:hypothetical protein